LAPRERRAQQTLLRENAHLRRQLNVQKRKVNRLQALSLTDELTGLPNRREFNETLARMVAARQRYNHIFSVAMIDIDLFKRINDTLGHQVGDRVLKQLAEILRKAVRKNDLVARWGGEEFSLILDATDLKNARIPLERIRRMVEEADFGIDRKVTISIGFASPSDSQTAEQLMAAADRALYKAKGSGRNRVCSSEEIQ
jgi:diguanylate cyclase (GGDEF)-like protein